MKKYKRGITFITADPLHSGHIQLCMNAKEYCERLVVCVATDENIEVRKKRKAFLPFKQRLEHVEQLKCVDNIGSQDHSKVAKKSVVRIYNSDVIFVSDEYKGKEWDGANLGIPVVYLPYTESVSSTQLRKEYGNN